MLRLLKTLFWIATPICLAAIAVSTFAGGVATWLSWTIGISLLLAMMCSGGIMWMEFRMNPLEESERGEWTNAMLFYALVFAITLFVAFLYLPTLLFA